MILAIDTSDRQCAVALGATTGAEEMQRGHAERLFPMIEAVMAEAGAAHADLSRIAVCTGPGSFTGIRVGVSAARGLALALAIPAIGVTRFDALALAAVAGRNDDRAPTGAAAQGDTGPEPGIAVAIAARGGCYRQDFPRGWPARGAPGPMRFEPGARPASPGPDWVLAGDGWAEQAAARGQVDPALVAALAATRVPGEPPAPCYLRAPAADPPREAPPPMLDG